MRNKIATPRARQAIGAQGTTGNAKKDLHLDYTPNWPRAIALTGVNIALLVVLLEVLK